jgi:DNA-directed RNA polymerase subunit M/transcription elongation factor TFIIS
MAMRKVACPSCGAVLGVPQESEGRKGRCRSCGTVFPIPLAVDEDELSTEGSASDEDIISWLAGSPEAEAQAGLQSAAADRPAGSAAPTKKAPTAKPPLRKAPATGARTSAEPRPKKRKFPVRLGHVDEMGAFFLFDPQLLHDEGFRCCFPQKCIVCGGKKHLSVHVVVWSNKLPGRGQFGMRTSYSQSVYALDELEGRTGRELLAALDRVESLPYYVCRACSPVGAIVTGVRFAPGGNRQECELGIFSLERAEEFIVAVRGPESRALVQVRRALEKTRDDPWRALPLAVRSRIGKWYERQEHERFIAYLPDGDFAKTEAGMAGIVVTDRRLVYRKFASRFEVPLTEKITISSKRSGRPDQLQILCPGQKPALFIAGPSGAERLRRCLSQQGARAKWVT